MPHDRPRPLWREPMLIAAVVVSGIAAVVVGAVVPGALSSPVLRAPVDADGVPVALPNGADLPSVDPALAAAFERPVVMVGAVEEPLGRLERCDRLGEWEFAPTLRASVITPEGLTVSIRGEERGTGALLHLTCFAHWGGRSWTSWASWTAEAADATATLGPPEPICCREDGLALGTKEVLVPEGTVWLVQDRGPYWLAYPVDDSALAHPVWPVDGGAGDPPQTVYLDGQGHALDQDSVES